LPHDDEDPHHGDKLGHHLLIGDIGLGTVVDDLAKGSQGTAVVEEVRDHMANILTEGGLITLLGHREAHAALEDNLKHSLTLVAEHKHGLLDGASQVELGDATVRDQQHPNIEEHEDTHEWDVLAFVIGGNVDGREEEGNEGHYAHKHEVVGKHGLKTSPEVQVGLPPSKATHPDGVVVQEDLHGTSSPTKTLFHEVVEAVGGQTASKVLMDVLRGEAGVVEVHGGKEILSDLY